MLSLYLPPSVQIVFEIPKKDLPSEINGFDDKSQCRTHRGDILVHNLLDNGRFPGIIQAPILQSLAEDFQRLRPPYSIKTRISLSFRRAFRRIDSMVPEITPLARRGKS